MAAQFGTSGLRGLVSELTPEVVGAHVAAFLRSCPAGTGLFVGRDLRDSSPAISAEVIERARAEGVDVTDCGAVPTPALALAAMSAGAAAVMVTGSHIPADRNGLKFYTPHGEITKAEEAAILSSLAAASVMSAQTVTRGRITHSSAGPAFVARYVAAFGATALSGWRLGLWSHSAVGRDLLHQTLQALGAEVVEIARSDQFIPVDTEAVAPDLRTFLVQTAQSLGLAAIVSTDGDGDRPLVADATGQIVPGDVLGQITARLLGAQVVVTPVSSNTGVEASGAFAQILRTKIGSPYVIAAMEAALTADPRARVVGYEANGGFLLGFAAETPAGQLATLMTRDSHLPIIAALVAAGDSPLAARVAAEPARFTAADRLQQVPVERSGAFVARLAANPAARDEFLSESGAGTATGSGTTDGLRLTLTSGRILHLRPSGNAPEFRCYAEAESVQAAQSLLASALLVLRGELEGG